MRIKNYALSILVLLLIISPCYAKSKKSEKVQAASVEENTETFHQYSNSASQKFFSKDIYGAITDFDKAIELSPQNPELYLNRGYIKHIANDKNGAMEDYNKAISLNKNFAFAYNNRGALKVSMGDVNGAIADYNQALAINPRYADVYYNRANLKYMLNDNKGALEDYDKTISLNPKDAEAYNNRGVVKKRMDCNVGALSDYTQAIAINPNDSIALANRGRLKKLYFDNEGAAIDLNQAVAMAEHQVFIKNVKPLLSKETYVAAIATPADITQKTYKNYTKDLASASGINAASKTSSNSAISGYKKDENDKVATGAIKAGVGMVKSPAEPDNPMVQPTTNAKLAESYYIRGLQKCILKDMEGAMSDLNKAISNNSKYAEAYFYRAAIKKEMGDTEGFRQDYSTAIQINPKLQSFNDNNALAVVR